VGELLDVGEEGGADVGRDAGGGEELERAVLLGTSRAAAGEKEEEREALHGQEMRSEQIMSCWLQFSLA
jgi:hypothetical protein